jgi:hypothetical protein
MSINACLNTAARRLRYLRTRPVEPYGKTYTPAEIAAAAFAYEYALRVVVDEFGRNDDLAALMYGNDPEYVSSWHSSIGA